MHRQLEALFGILTFGICGIFSFARSQGEASANSTASNAITRSPIEIHLFGGDESPDAPMAKWYGQIGITDVWLYPVAGAFPQDQKPSDQRSISQLTADRVLQAYKNNSIRVWWFERPVPDYAYYQLRDLRDVDAGILWGSSVAADALWAGVCQQIGLIYPQARAAGFSGIVYDNEAYYSYVGAGKPWLWAGHDDQLGTNGAYYKRGYQVGSAIKAVWPDARLIMVYAFGYRGEYWWYRGFHDAGVDLYIGPEQTYGAGPARLGDQWYQHWWNAGKLLGIVKTKRAFFDFIPDDRHVISGLFPIDFNQARQNYDLRYFHEQLAQAASLEGSGPFAVWLWPQGQFSPDTWNAIQYQRGVTADDYWNLLREYSGRVKTP